MRWIEALRMELICFLPFVFVFVKAMKLNDHVDVWLDSQIAHCTLLLQSTVCSDRDGTHSSQCFTDDKSEMLQLIKVIEVKLLS